MLLDYVLIRCLSVPVRHIYAIFIARSRKESLRHGHISVPDCGPCCRAGWACHAAIFLDEVVRADTNVAHC